MRHAKVTQDELPLFEADRLRHAYSVAFHTTQGGEVHAVVGRMDLTSRRYTFRQLPVASLEPGTLVGLDGMVELLAELIRSDTEDEVIRI